MILSFKQVSTNKSSKFYYQLGRNHNKSYFIFNFLESKHNSSYVFYIF